MYNKLFTKILDSSVWLESHATRIVWLTLLSAMDQDGMCHFASVANLARRAIVTIEEARQAVTVLEGPDHDSSDPDNDGKRIERVPGGWIVLNAPKYRQAVTAEESRRLARERQARWREKKNVTPNHLQNDGSNADVTQKRDRDALRNGCVTQSEAVAEAEAEEQKQKPSATPDGARSKKPEKVPDPRHAACKAAVMSYGAFKRVTLPWDKSEAKQLSLLLASAPEMTVKDFQACLNHRARSPGTPHGERPRLWLPNILRYQQGPLNHFNRTEETHATHGSKYERSQASTQRVLNDLLGGDVDFPATAGGRTLEAGTGV